MFPEVDVMSNCCNEGMEPLLDGVRQGWRIKDQHPKKRIRYLGTQNSGTRPTSDLSSGATVDPQLPLAPQRDPGSTGEGTEAVTEGPPMIATSPRPSKEPRRKASFGSESPHDAERTVPGWFV